jgi:hypothetical protein
MDCEKSKVQKTNLRNLNAGYLGHLHNLRPEKGLAKTERMTDNSLRGSWKTVTINFFLRYSTFP